MLGPWTWLALLALAAAPAAASTFADKGFLLTCPKTLIAGTTENCCVSIYQLQRQRVQLSVNLVPKVNSTNAESLAKHYSSKYIYSASDFHCFRLSLPKDTRSGSLHLRVSVSARRFQSTKVLQISVLPYTLVTLVQTDKTKYKAGQTVQFRVLTLKSDLTAQEETVKQIFITTPSGTRLAQWDNQATNKGIIALKFSLTQEPPLGTWTIHVQRGDRITRQTFEVDEFVLPRFEVTVSGPKFIVQDANTVTLKVCAKYTFGEPVTSADVVLFAHRTVPSYFYRRNNFGQLDERGKTPSNVTLKDKSDSEGCAEFDVILSQIGVGSTFRSRFIYVNQVMFRANVTEAGTGLLLGTDLTLPIQTPRIDIQLDSQPGANFIKPGLEYVGFATVKGADGSPLSSELLQICHTETFVDQGAIKPIETNDNPFVSFPRGNSPRGGERLVSKSFTRLPIIHLPVNEKTDRESCREYKSNKDGRVRFRIEAQSAGIVRSNINVRTRRSSGPSGSGYASLRGWFSLTDSYITIIPNRDPYELKCEGSLQLTVRASVNTPQMTYVVMTRGQIHTSGQVARDGTIEIQLGFKVSPSFKVLVYYVNRVGETIADSKTYNVAECFQNKVKVSWNKKKVEPGDKVVLSIEGAANSLCGVSVVDRSVELLSDKNKLTAQKVFEQLRQFVIAEYASPRLVQSAYQYCKRKPRYARPGRGHGVFDEFDAGFEEADAEISGPERELLGPDRRSIIIPPRPPGNGEYYYTTRQDDSLKAFDVAGYLVFSNFVLESRPCERNNRTRYYYRGDSLGRSDGPIFFSRSAGSAGPVAETIAFGNTVAVNDAAAPPAAASEPVVRSLFPPTFLFQLQALGGVAGCDGARVVPFRRQLAGLVPITNLVLESRPCQRSIRRTRPVRRRYRRFLRRSRSSRRGQPRALAAGSSSGPLRRSLAARTSTTPRQRQPAAADQPPDTVRSIIPRTFLFELQAVGPTGRSDIEEKMPDTITSWVASAFCSGHQGGFGLSESTSITTFKPFFAQIQVPYSVKRGEVLRLKVSVFNFLSSDLSVAVVLAQSNDYSVSGGGSSTRMVCVRASKPVVVEFPIEFSSLGTVPITVTAKTSGNECGGSNAVEASDALRRTLVVKPEGFPQEEVNTAFLCKEDTSSADIVQSFPLAEPNHLVPDSDRAWVNVVGDLIAPSADNLERLVRVPTGCGEQNMIGFVPNILVRRYLEETKLLTDSLRDRTTANMQTGYQRQLRYRRSEGSYSAFPERSPPRYKGSLWLTAYVVRAYLSASRYIAIDKNDVSISTSWMVKLQEPSGAFQMYGDLFHKEMRGGVANGAQEAFTAYVLLTLLEAKDQPKAAEKALDFLLASTQYSTLYAEILVAHAIVVAGKTVEGAERVKTILAKGVQQGGQLHWMGDRAGPVGGSRAVDVEMTSYMVLTLLKLGGQANLDKAALAIKWINAQRNSQGGFVSTQDTVLALTALTEFAIATYSPDTDVSVRVTALPDFTQTVLVTAANRLLTRQHQLPKPLAQPGNRVTFTVSGKGCAVVQSVFRYNTKVAFPDPKFNLKATIKKVKSTCAFTLNICTSFKQPNAKSNMAIVEIEMLSGYLPVDSTLNKLDNDKVIDRWEQKEGKVSLYFDKFDNNDVCFDVRMIRSQVVDKLKPAVVRVYDYYAHEDRFEVTYGPPECT